MKIGDLVLYWDLDRYQQRPGLVVAIAPGGMGTALVKTCDNDSWYSIESLETISESR